MNEKSLLKDEMLEKLEQWRKILQKVLIGIVIGEFIFGAIMILTHGNTNEVVSKIAGTFLIIAFSILFVMSNFKCMCKKQRAAQIFSFVSLGATAIWLGLSILGVWEIIPITSTLNRLEPLGKFESFVGELMVFGLIGSWIAVIKENGGPIKALKITAISSLVFFLVYLTVVLFTFDQSSIDPTFAALAGLAALAFIVTWCMAAAMSRRNEKEKLSQMVEKKNMVSDEDVQKKIQEEVQRQVAEALKKKDNE